jgi:hypothetical protein
MMGAKAGAHRESRAIAGRNLPDAGDPETARYGPYRS